MFSSPLNSKRTHLTVLIRIVQNFNSWKKISLSQCFKTCLEEIQITQKQQKLKKKIWCLNQNRTIRQGYFSSKKLISFKVAPFLFFQTMLKSRFSRLLHKKFFNVDPRTGQPSIKDTIGLEIYLFLLGKHLLAPCHSPSKVRHDRCHRHVASHVRN